MTVPRWLVPVLSVIAAAAVAVAATLFGTQLTAQPASPAARTETVPVLEPVPVGDDGMPLPDSDGDPHTIDTSPSDGGVEIVSPGTGDPSDVGARVQSRIDALDSSAGLDEIATRDALSAADGASAPPPGDPCSPAPAGEDCPDGLHGAVLALTEPQPLHVFPRADPPTDLAGSGGLVACPSAGDEGMSFGVATTIPASVTVRYWPVDDPAAEQTVTIDGDPADEAAWDAAVAGPDGYPSDGLYQHCTVLPDLRPNTVYESSTFAVDVLLRISDPVSLTFDSRGAATRPPMVVTPLSSSLVYVSVPSTERGPLPWLRAWVVPPDEPADCSAFDSHIELRRVLDENVVDVSPEWIAARNYLPAYSVRVTNVFSVPEGSRVVFCARWYDASAPSWSRDIPTDQVSATVDSPDAYSPVVTVTGLSLANDVDARAIRLSASTQLGIECDTRAMLPESDARAGSAITVDAVLCAPGRATSATHDALGSGGNIVVTSHVLGTDLTSSTLLPLSRYECLGDCPTPPTLTYQVLLPTTRVGSGMCGSSFGESCTPPSREVALGTATVTVTWEQGADSGQSEWSVGPSEYVVPDAAVVDHPQLDTLQVLRPVLSADGFSAHVSVPIRTDRHAAYRASIAGDCFIGDTPTAVEGETAFVAAGGQGADVLIGGLCPGSQYRVTVELTADDGARAVYGFAEPASRSWYDAQFRVPRNELEFTGTIEIRNVADTPVAWRVPGAAVTLGGPGSFERFAEFPADRCFADTERSTVGTFSGRVPQSRIIHVSAMARAVTEGQYQGVDRDADCSWGEQSWNGVDFEADVDYDDLIRGVTFTAPLRPDWIPPGGHYDAEFEAVVTIRATTP